MTDLSNLKILRRREVESIIKLSRSTIYNLMAKGEFPKPIKLGARAIGWLESDIRDWLNQRATGDIEP
ncbi:AlpA family transcriptional regulator [Ruegeria pomeroyi]|uniref:AlpA family transcriptional regulator n=1 Tax=Ruegeria pomeroyi TaxID=89184 RepID=A0A9Q3WQN1_9RHOB|nr:AlpA family transcriptional regulator [Ruegeria pomeroyi]MCE8540279.1 AlpA family transcriptional regulator [Ruegeria pomeroyi]